MTTARTHGQRTRNFAVVGLMVLAVVAALTLGRASSNAADVPPPISAEELMPRSEFTDDVNMQIRLQPDGRPRQVLNLRDPSRVAVAKITVQPGARFPWHTHPGPVIASVKEGKLAYAYADDCVERPYPAGTTFIDPGGSVHTAVNPSRDDEAVVVAMFLDAPETGPLTLPIPQQEANLLDGKCGFGPASHSH